MLTARQTQPRKPTSKDSISTVALLLCRSPFFLSLTQGESHSTCVRAPFSLMTATTIVREGLCLQWLQCSSAWLKYGFSWHQDRQRDILNFIEYHATRVRLRDPFPFLPAPGQQHSLLQQRPQAQPNSNPRDPQTLLYYSVLLVPRGLRPPSGSCFEARRDPVVVSAGDPSYVPD